MLKFIFFCLLIANALLLALGQGYFDNPVFEPHQPQRVALQQNAAQLKLISAETATAPVVVEAPASSPATAPSDTPAAGAACLEWGAFANTDLAKVDDKLKTLSFGNRQSRVNIQDTSTTMVFIPPLGSKEAADKKALELTHLGVHDYFIITDQTNMRWGISMGVFKSEELAKQHLASLVSKGVHSAKIGVHAVDTNKFNYTFKNVSPAERVGLDKLKADYPTQDLHQCKS